MLIAFQIIHYDDNEDDDDDDDDDADSDRSSAPPTTATNQLSPSTSGSVAVSETSRPRSAVATPPGRVTSPVEGLRHGRGIPVVPSRLIQSVPSSATASAIPPPAAVPLLSLIHI